MLKIVRTKYKSLTIQEKKILLSLTFRNYSGIRESIREIKRYETKNHIIYIKDQGLIVGWATMVLSDDGREYDCMFYVRRGCRRKGYGKILNNEILKICFRDKKKPYVYPNWENFKFFKNVGYPLDNNNDLFWKRGQSWKSYFKKENINA